LAAEDEGRDEDDGEACEEGPASGGLGGRSVVDGDEDDDGREEFATFWSEATPEAGLLVLSRDS
jgi:hypothetical protein